MRVIIEGIDPRDTQWEADQEVLGRARTKARPDQFFVLYAEHRDAQRSGLVRLLGIDPTSAAWTVAPAEVRALAEVGLRFLERH
jgi:hypothetical protein